MTPKSLEKIRDEVYKIVYRPSFKNGFDAGVSAVLFAPEFKSVLEALRHTSSDTPKCPGCECSDISLLEHCDFVAKKALAAFNQWVKG